MEHSELLRGQEGIRPRSPLGWVFRPEQAWSPRQLLVLLPLNYAAQLSSCPFPGRHPRPSLQLTRCRVRAVSRRSVRNQLPGSSPGRATLPSLCLVFRCAWCEACLGGGQLASAFPRLKNLFLDQSTQTMHCSPLPSIGFTNQPERVAISWDGGSLRIPASRHPLCPLQGCHKDVVHSPGSWEEFPVWS